MLFRSELVAWLDKRTIRDVVREGLHETFTYVVDQTHEIGEAIHRTFFAAEMKPPAKESENGKAQAQRLTAQS